VSRLLQARSRSRIRSNCISAFGLSSETANTFLIKVSQSLAIVRTGESCSHPLLRNSVAKGATEVTQTALTLRRCQFWTGVLRSRSCLLSCVLTGIPFQSTIVNGTSAALIVLILGGKGNRDREVMLTQALFDALR
jgi:hypothetical protein